MKNKKAFTLVELLAVIVILAVILVIAVPQILDVIDTTKVGSLESSAKLIASTAEKKYAEFLALGKDTSTIKCSDVSKLNNKDYGTCTISFDENGKATVTIKGKDDGKFDGLKCEGTKDNMVCGDIPPLPVVNCTFTPSEEDLVETAKVYTVKDYDACMTYLKSTIPEEELTDEILNQADSICKGNGIPEYGESTSEIFEGMISGSTEIEQELIDLNVINVNFVKYTIKDYDACMTNLENVVINEWNMTNEDLDGICKGTGDISYGNSTHINIEYIIGDNYFTEQELINLNVINIEKIINPELRNGAEYVHGQYTYRYGQEYAGNDWHNTDINGWGVTLTDKESTDSVVSEVCSYINDKPITSMSYMFYKSNALSLDLNNLNTSNVKSMSFMFFGSTAKTLDLSSFDTSNVTDMSDMFRESDATIIDLSSFDTSNVIDMSGMFRYMAATNLDLSNFNTSNVIDMNSMFYFNQIINLDLSSFDTSNVINMSYMFSKSAIPSLDLSSFDTSNVTDMRDMFYGSSVTSLDLSSFNTSNVTNMSYMFALSNVASLDLSSFDTSNVTDMSDMFSLSAVTTGYARTQADADKFNSSSNKPSALTFVVKGS